MHRHINLPPKKSLSGQGQELVSEQAKDTKISEFLKAVPFLIFSDTGIRNIAKRFNITEEELRQRIADFEAREGQ